MLDQLQKNERIGKCWICSFAENGELYSWKLFINDSLQLGFFCSNGHFWLYNPKSNSNHLVDYMLGGSRIVKESPRIGIEPTPSKASESSDSFFPGTGIIS